MAELSPPRRDLAARERAPAPLHIPDELADRIMLAFAAACTAIAVAGAWGGWW